MDASVSGVGNPMVFMLKISDRHSRIAGNIVFDDLSCPVSRAIIEHDNFFYQVKTCLHPHRIQYLPDSLLTVVYRDYNTEHYGLLLLVIAGQQNCCRLVHTLFLLKRKSFIGLRTQAPPYKIAYFRKKTRILAGTSVFWQERKVEKIRKNFKKIIICSFIF